MCTNRPRGQDPGTLPAECTRGPGAPSPLAAWRPRRRPLWRPFTPTAPAAAPGARRNRPPLPEAARRAHPGALAPPLAPPPGGGVSLVSRQAPARTPGTRTRIAQSDGSFTAMVQGRLSGWGGLSWAKWAASGSWGLGGGWAGSLLTPPMAWPAQSSQSAGGAGQCSANLLSLWSPQRAPPCQLAPLPRGLLPTPF